MCMDKATTKSIYIFSSVVTVMFDQSIYSVDEDDGPAQPVLVLSNPSSMEFNVTVFNTDESATGGSTIGEYYSILISH